MQCYEYLAVQRYARRYLGSWTEKYDDLELAEALDERHVQSIPDIRKWRAGSPGSTASSS